MREPLRVIVIGATPLAAKIISAIEKLPSIQLVGAVTLHPHVGAAKSNYCALSDYAVQHPHDILYTKDVNDAATVSWLRILVPDVIIQAGWSQIFKPVLLKLPRLFCIGVHPAPLPIGRGAAVINWKLLEGGGSWGNSLFVMEEKTDTGDLLDFEPFQLEPRDDAHTAYLKVDRTGVKMVVRTLLRIAAGDITRRTQKGERSTRYYRRRPEDGAMQFGWPADKVLNYVRALTHPYPGAFFALPEGKLIVWRASRTAGVVGRAPGTVLDIIPGSGMTVQIGDNAGLHLLEVTPPDGLECWCDIWAQEHSLQAGTELGRRADRSPV